VGVGGGDRVMWGSDKTKAKSKASPKHGHKRSQSWHNLNFSESLFGGSKKGAKQSGGWSGEDDGLPIKRGKEWRGLSPKPVPSRSKKWRALLDMLIVGTFIMIIVNFYLSDGAAMSRRVCPKIVHGKNSSYELYHKRKGPRIVLSSGAYNNVVDGVSRTLNRLVGDLQERGFRVLVLAPHVEPPAMQHEGMLLPVPSISLPFRPEYAFASGLDSCTREVLQEHDPSLVMIATPDYLGQQVQKWAIERGLPIGCSYHTRFSSYLPYYIGEPLLHNVDGALWNWLHYFYQGCDHVYPPTTRVGNEITDHGVTTPMMIWPRGIDVSTFNVRYRSEQQRKEWGIKPGEVVVLFASRLVWEKNVRVYIDTLNTLLKQKHKVRPVVVGAGPALANIRDELPKAIIMGHQAGEDLSTAFASSDIFFFPSLTETWGNVCLEAMASGVPIIVAKGPGGSELVQHNKTGWFVDVTNPVDTVRGLKELVTNPKLRRRLAATALEAIRSSSDFDWKHVTDILVGHYDKLLKMPPKPTAIPQVHHRRR